MMLAISSYRSNQNQLIGIAANKHDTTSTYYGLVCEHKFDYLYYTISSDNGRRYKHVAQIMKTDGGNTQKVFDIRLNT